jgi:hypothetical protein
LELFHTFILTDNQQISHRATPFLRFQRSRPDRPDFFLIQKRNSAGGHQKMQKSGLAGRVSLWLANVGACAVLVFNLLS